MTAAPSIAVIIAARNAAGTIAQAVESALQSERVVEVVVVDDASADNSAAQARAAARGDPRLLILSQTENQGPAACRNWAIRESSAPLIAILDADDRFLPGRFEAMTEDVDWDLYADNILFFSDDEELPTAADAPGAPQMQSVALDFSDFVRGNMPRRGSPRGELGFLKPVMRRATIEQLGLRYNTACRLGEDFLFYLTALALGARFRIVPTCGYAALVRQDSLSSRHRTADLAALYNEEMRLLRELPLDVEQQRLLSTHAASTHRKLTHRQVLDIRQSAGIRPGIIAAATRPSAIVDILSDKLRPVSVVGNTPRRLFEPGDLVRYAR